ncbi:MAG TPA: hypothetical protein VFO14_22730 [Vicinamibacterales bacterium]|nr:hypothetical protein [Vicinamibacterales bacterium]
MSVDAVPRREAALTSARTPTAVSGHHVPGPLRRIAAVGADVLALGALVFGFPFVILGIGSAIALLVQPLLWLGRLL